MLAIFQTILRGFARPLRFGVVGVSGILVNSAVLWALVQGPHIAVPLASVLATETAILSNFMLNDRWTFGGARQRSLIQRLWRFNGVALGGMAITAIILTALTTYTHLHLLLSNVLAVGSATAWNYLVNSRWTWSGQSPAASRQSPVVGPQPANSLQSPADCNREEVLR